MKSLWIAALVLLAMATTPALARDETASPPPAAAAPAASTDSQTIYVVIGVTHSDLVIPRAAFARSPPRVRAAVDQLGEGSWVVVGWGPDWFGRDKLISPPGRAAELTWTLLIPQSKSRLRLATVPSPGPAPDNISLSLIPIHLSASALDAAIRRIDRTFTAGPDGGPTVTYRPPGEPNVAIFLSGEHYSIFHECNHWVADVLRSGGLPIPMGLDLLPATLALGASAADALHGSPAAVANGAADAGGQLSRVTPVQTAPAVANGAGGAGGAGGQLSSATPVQTAQQ